MRSRFYFASSSAIQRLSHPSPSAPTTDARQTPWERGRSNRHRRCESRAVAQSPGRVVVIPAQVSNRVVSRWRDHRPGANDSARRTFPKHRALARQLNSPSSDVCPLSHRRRRRTSHRVSLSRSAFFILRLVVRFRIRRVVAAARPLRIDGVRPRPRLFRPHARFHPALAGHPSSPRRAFHPSNPTRSPTPP